MDPSSANACLTSARRAGLLAAFARRDQELVSSLVVPRTETARHLAPGRPRRLSALRATFAATVVVVDRVHRRAADRRAHAHPALAARFAEDDVFVLLVAELP